MATREYLNEVGLEQVWEKIKDYVDNSSDNDNLSLAISNNVIQLKEGNTVISSVTLPVYNGGVSS